MYLSKRGSLKAFGRVLRFKNLKQTLYLVSKYDFVSVGQPLTSGNVNPHTLLKTYYNYFKEIFTKNLTAVPSDTKTVD